jgi:hypothetical protein
MESLFTKVDRLNYSTIEHEIANYFDMGYVDSSGLPHVLSEDCDNTYYITATRKHGDFHIKITKQPDGMYSLFVSAYNLKSHKR